MYDKRDSLERKYYLKQERSHSSYQKDNCFVETHTIAGSGTNLTGNIPLRIDLPAGTTQTVFEDFTRNHNKTLLQLTTLGKGAAVTVTIRTRRSSSPITDIIPGDFGTKIFQVEDFESLTISNPSTDSSGILAFIQKTFCICCKDQKKKCDCWDN